MSMGYSAMGMRLESHGQVEICLAATCWVYRSCLGFQSGPLSGWQRLSGGRGLLHGTLPCLQLQTWVSRAPCLPGMAMTKRRAAWPHSAI